MRQSIVVQTQVCFLLALPHPQSRRSTQQRQGPLCPPTPGGGACTRDIMYCLRVLPMERAATAEFTHSDLVLPSGQRHRLAGTE